MAEYQKFRSALNGFNREDVVRYIEYINNRHAFQVNQLKDELQTLKAKCMPSDASCEDLAPLLEQSKARCSALEAEIVSLQAQLAEALQGKPKTSDELEAYRRAERAESAAKERVNQLYAQANGVLSEATLAVDNTATQIGTISDQICAQLSQLQAAVTSGKDTINAAAAALYAVHPIDEQK